MSQIVLILLNLFVSFIELEKGCANFVQSNVQVQILKPCVNKYAFIYISNLNVIGT